MTRHALYLLAMAGCAQASTSPTRSITAPAAAPAPTSGAPRPPVNSLWRPVAGATWHIQLQGTLDTTPDVEIYDVDLFETPAKDIARLHAEGRRVVCYFNAGAFESWRPDAAGYPPSVIGRPLAQWPGERWLDVRSEPVRRAVEGRLELAVSKSCDGVDPDNVDGWSAATGFGFGSRDQLEFNRFIARAAHARGLAVGLKNDTRQAAQLAGDFDFAVVEECFRFHECDRTAPFLDAGKSVFELEYGGRAVADAVCPEALRLGLSTLVMPLALDGSARIACR
jgi:hypothetical protein